MSSPRRFLSGSAALVTLWLAANVHLLPGQTVPPEVPKAGAPTKPADDQDKTSIRYKASHIIVPAIEFRNTSINDSVEFLRQEGRRLDTEPNEGNHGVNILLMLREPEPPTPATPGPPASVDTDDPPQRISAKRKRINISMTNLPLLEALRYVAIEADLKLVVEQYAICLVPSETNMNVMGTTQDRLPMAEFPMHLEILGMQAVSPPVNSDDKSNAITRLDPKPWLTQHGITFPEGASATYVASTQRLVVRNTKENLDRIQALLEPAEAAK